MRAAVRENSRRAPARLPVTSSSRPVPRGGRASARRSEHHVPDVAIPAHQLAPDVWMGDLDECLGSLAQVHSEQVEQRRTRSPPSVRFACRHAVRDQRTVPVLEWASPPESTYVTLRPSPVPLPFSAPVPPSSSLR